MQRAPATASTFIKPHLRSRLASDPRGFVSVLEPDRTEDPSRFNGAYGRIYDLVMQQPSTRRGAGWIWGGGTALEHIGQMVSTAISGLGTDSTILDVPCGGGSLFPMLDHRSYRGTVIACDLSGQMLERAASRVIRQTPGIRTILMQCDAMDLPLRDAVVDRVISINGLHCMPDAAGFLGQIRRVLRSGSGEAWLTTMVSSASRHHMAVMAAARRAGIIPRNAPTRAELLRMAREAGFAHVEDLGGRGIMSLRLRVDD